MPTNYIEDEVLIVDLEEFDSLARRVDAGAYRKLRTTGTDAERGVYPDTQDFPAEFTPSDDDEYRHFPSDRVGE